jgi:hypothetical protein
MTTGPSLPPPRPPSPAPPPPPSPWTLPTGTHRPQPAPGLATAALVCGIVGLLLFFVVAPSIVALVLGLVAWQRARAAPGPGDARGRALAGWILGLIGVVGFVAILISAIATGDLDDDDSLGVGDLRAGQCIDVPEDERIAAVPERDCDEPHDAEVYLVRRLDGTGYPGEETVRQQARAICAGAAFEEYFGVSFADSALDATYLWPTEDNWRAGDHEVVCAAVRGDGRPLTTSMAGAGD